MGANFTNATAVSFGTTAATVHVTAPPDHRDRSGQSAGTVDVTVTTPGGTSATSAADLTHLRRAASLTVTWHQPGSAGDRQGMSVTITGTNLAGATAVKLRHHIGHDSDRRHRDEHHRHRARPAPPAPST